MIFVSLALVALLAATVITFAGLLRSERRASARERDLLLNQLLHAVGKPWTPAPAEAPAPPLEPEEIMPSRYVANPSSLVLTTE